MSVAGWLRLTCLCQRISQKQQNHALETKSCHEMRSIDQGTRSELAASEPKWGVTTRRVACDTHPFVAARTEVTHHWPLAHHAVRGWN